MRHPDPSSFREAEVALEGDESYRGFLSRGRIAGRLRRMLGGSEWDFRRPYLPRDEVERLRRHLSEVGADARWDGDILVVDDPRGRWRPSRIVPDRHGLYQVGVLGRAVRPASGFQRDWEEVVALPRDRALDPPAIASALGTGLPLGPAFDRITSEVDVPTLIDSLSLVRTDHARDRLCILLAHHPNAPEAAAALETIASYLDATDTTLRRGAAYALRTIVGRVGSRRVTASAPALTTALLDRLGRRDDRETREDVAATLAALGHAAPEASDAAARAFIAEARNALDFLMDEYGFGEPTADEGGSSTSLAYLNETTGVVASADWRDDLGEVYLVKLDHGALPVHLDTELTHWIAPSLLADGIGRDAATGEMPSPRSRADTRRFLEREADALRRLGDALRGDFARFDRALARLREGMDDEER